MHHNYVKNANISIDFYIKCESFVLLARKNKLAALFGAAANKKS